MTTPTTPFSPFGVCDTEGEHHAENHWRRGECQNWRSLSAPEPEPGTRFRKKPVVVEARQWDGTAEGAGPIINWILSGDQGAARYHDAQPAVYDKVKTDMLVSPALPATIRIDTLEGLMMASPKDWVIRGVQGEFYPCKPDIFAATYDRIGTEGSTGQTGPA